mmetsp:Transcript_67542/g.170437  ORF Transcript_67542/g.170437 Transcript_67542/m.170437 type:complete len:121 (+) Transcript_67542:479-841(+)
MTTITVSAVRVVVESDPCCNHDGVDGRCASRKAALARCQQSTATLPEAMPPRALAVQTPAAGGTWHDATRRRASQAAHGHPRFIGADRPMRLWDASGAARRAGSYHASWPAPAAKLLGPS